jgi:plastocyanin
MRKLLVMLVVVSIMGALAATAWAAKTRTVGVDDNVFLYKGKAAGTIKIKTGDKMVWRWKAGGTVEQHNVYIRDLTRKKDVTRSGEGFKTSGSVKKTFKRIGKYRVICELHPSQMRMTIRVGRR